MIINSAGLRWAEDVACLADIRNSYKIFGQKASKEGPLGRLRHRWEHNIKVNFTEIWCEGMAWVYLASLDGRSCKYNKKICGP
jgi:hypothetical protein